ncbi:hypothetical protein G9U53_32690 [Rhodococcus sp. D-46]|nr:MULTISPECIES: hypothetical protein [Rhodococcus]NHE69061.1 hypothetical protein [Rhodococcus sp. D-46]MBF7737654.1 hypothetical protein [Rhodococcus erythropolis]MBS2993494.1 hypothetical protein [Rhodococcus erythropolis]MCD2136299.1 hypothetical protein [Rhodococcus qingshengii]MCJ0901599.1 hypothetical protein [Rhodococcus sp. ARC_M13]
MTRDRCGHRVGANVLLPGRGSYAIACVMGFYVLALIVVFTCLVPRLSARSETVVTAAVVVVFAVLLLLAMMFAARTPRRAASAPIGVVEGWAVVLDVDIGSGSVALKVTVPGSGTYRSEVHVSRSMAVQLVVGSIISVWVDPDRRQRMTLVGSAPPPAEAPEQWRH